VWNNCEIMIVSVVDTITSTMTKTNILDLNRQQRANSRKEKNEYFRFESPMVESKKNRREGD